MCGQSTVTRFSIDKVTRKLNVYVMEGNYDLLVGREWITHFATKINWETLFAANEQIKVVKVSIPNLQSNEQRRMQSILTKYDNIFSEQPGKLAGTPVSLYWKPLATPLFCKARPIPLALRKIDLKIAAELYERIEYSEWASLTHIVTKKNGKIWIPA